MVRGCIDSYPSKELIQNIYVANRGRKGEKYMARDFNFITVHGTVGKDPVLKVIGEGTEMVSFSLAVNDVMKGENVTTWLDITSFSSQEFIMRNIAKGSRVLVSGRLTVRNYIGSDGVTKTAVGILANHVEKTNWEKKVDSKLSDPVSIEPNTAPTVQDDSDLPF